MGKFRIEPLADLARQMGFAPRDTRLAQITAAEVFLHEIDPNKAYPFELVVHKVTGYRPRDYSEDLYAGQALQHDLGLLIETVSDTLDVKTSQADEPVLTIEDVTARFNVTSKTIQRWRRRGLPARRFVFPDGKRRVGFLLGSVERFFSGHEDQVTRGMNFSQVSESERQEILRRARRLAVMCHCCVSEVCRRVARKLNRSPLTVQHIIRKHDQEHPAAAVFALAPAPLTEEERARILRGYRRGLALKSLARRACRPASAVYRVVLEERVAKLNRRKVNFIDDPLYHQPDGPEQIDAIVAGARAAATMDAGGRPEDRRVPRDIPAYLQELYRTPLLTPPLERALFLKFHLHKFQFISARRALEPQFARARDIDLLDARLATSTEVKNQIVRANLRLVVSIARKHLRPGLDLMELISEGNLTLMRAVESFDVHKGNRFSTYATLALMKGFARSVPQMLAGRRATGGDAAMLAAVPDGRFGSSTTADRFAAREEVGRLLGRLTDRERIVVLAQYGLDGASVAREDLSTRLGVSPQQLRQIERTAIAKLRTVIGVANLG
ncbi:MAG: polymerase sigma factor, sigma-70 family [Phycisphaerales bacterium]|nr:polymerase sigma factor, sigma-70 family [Phycisphaerales bacterium]